ncbi:MAG: hypothetical protein M3Y87_11815 [Myxococcota bacterium]|nr:hypothetical protein [Myxococcota bacterium]
MTDQGQGGGGFTPLTPIGGPTLEEEERALKSGRGKMIAGMVFAVLIAVGGLIWFVGSQQPSEYGQIGRQINGMRADHFDAFWACALPRADLRDIRNDQQLRTEIARRAASPRPYAQHVRSECIVRLDEHVSPLNALIVPEDLAPAVEQLRAAINAQRQAWSSFLDYLEHVEGAFDPEAADEHLTAIARGWFEYKVAHGAINDVLRTHVDE